MLYAFSIQHRKWNTGMKKSLDEATNTQRGLPFSATITSTAKNSPKKVVVRSRIELFKKTHTPFHFSIPYTLKAQTAVKDISAEPNQENVKTLKQRGHRAAYLSNGKAPLW